jgi:hypothetical protein
MTKKKMFSPKPSTKPSIVSPKCDNVVHCHPEMLPILQALADTLTPEQMTKLGAVMRNPAKRSLALTALNNF